MKKIVVSFFVLTLLLTLTTLAQETITLTTYYPSPFGVYKELRAQQVAIGPTYFNASDFPWDEGGTLESNEIPQGVDLVVEGDVGIGALQPNRTLHVRSPNAVIQVDRNVRSPAIQLHNFVSDPSSWSSSEVELGFGAGVYTYGMDDGFFFIAEDLNKDFSTGPKDVGGVHFAVRDGGAVGVGTYDPSFGGEQDLKLDVEGAVGAKYYCDEDGNNCDQPPFTGSGIVTGVYTGNGATSTVDLGFRPQLVQIIAEDDIGVNLGVCFLKSDTMTGGRVWVVGRAADYKGAYSMVGGFMIEQGVSFTDLGFKAIFGPIVRGIRPPNINGNPYHYIAYR